MSDDVKKALQDKEIGEVSGGWESFVRYTDNKHPVRCPNCGNYSMDGSIFYSRKRLGEFNWDTYFCTKCDTTFSYDESESFGGSDDW